MTTKLMGLKFLVWGHHKMLYYKQRVLSTNIKPEQPHGLHYS